MSAREDILNTVRRRLNRRQSLEASLQAALEARLRDSRPGPQPEWSEEVVARFVAKSEAVHCSVAFVDKMSSVPQAVEEYLAEQQLPRELVAAPHPLLTGLDWLPETAISWQWAEGRDSVGLSVAYAGIAETGTVALLSSESSPASINFLPSAHIIVLQGERILRQQEDLWVLLRSESMPMPRALNLVTGPSKTGDVEQTIVYGAHGPSQVHLLIAD
ncbi:MAG: LUD domain-containing protein [Pseudomonadota bacterium]|nr:LUD domain-containing protein [Pseudomonadota bacterium]